MKDITIIVPIHEFDKELLTKALKSVTKDEHNNILFVGPKDVCESAVKLCAKLKITIPVDTCINDEETDFVTQINKATFACVTPYFTILEYDDEFTDTYFNVMQKYIEERPELSIILPINEYYKDGEMASFGNEIALDPSFSENIGVIGLEELETFMDFNCTGGLFKTEDFISLGGLKKSLKIAAWYEFLMRAVQKERNIYVIPKICYKHTIGRNGSYMVKSKEEISAEEGQFLIASAREEYFFKEDRNKAYEPENNKDE